jgi:predicted TPR repeat methyltransferase
VRAAIAICRRDRVTPPPAAVAAARAGHAALLTGDLAAARAGYARAAELAPNERTVLAGYGTTLQLLGELDAAHEVFARCTALHPHAAEDWCNLGGVYCALGRLDQAAHAYREALGHGPAFAPAWRGLVWALTHSSRLDERRAAVAEWAAASPDDPTARHLDLAARGGPAPVRCEAAFVTEHFDDFARDYDRVLAQLETSIAATFAAFWRDAAVTARTVLDAGCGTGSASVWLRGPDRRVVGVDLSPRMLERAAARGLYAELHCADVLAFLAATELRFDAIVLADVLPYFGDTAALFAAAARALAPGGHLLLSHETATTPGHVLAVSGRFQQHPDAIHAAAVAAGFTCRAQHTGSLRREAAHAVAGRCVLFAKSSIP